MPRGKVKWYDQKKGFGFIIPDDGGQDVFVHHTAIQMDGFRMLEDGQEVAFEITQVQKGLQAVNVTNVDGSRIAAEPRPGREGATDYP